MNTPWIILIAAVLISGLLFVIGRYFTLWLMAYATGTHIGIVSLMLMSLRKVDPRVIVQCRIMAVQAGLTDFPTRAIESQYLAGGNVQRVTLPLIAAHRAGIDLDWDTAAAIDLSGRNILEAVQVSVNPRVINCPDPESGRGNTLDGVAKDGIQLKVHVLVTVRTKMKLKRRRDCRRFIEPPRPWKTRSRNRKVGTMSFNVQELCQRKGVSLLSLVERSGMDFTRLQAIYLGRWTPNPTQRASIARALGTPSGDIAWQHSTPVEHFYGP